MQKTIKHQKDGRQGKQTGNINAFFQVKEL
jgi:hypothetical protein